MLCDKQNEQTERIARMAKSQTENLPSKWQFEPTGMLYVNNRDTDTMFGSIRYENTLYEFGPAIKICDWVFALERLTPEGYSLLSTTVPESTWLIVAFHGDSHYTFKVVPDTLTTRNEFVEYLLRKFWPILRPELYKQKPPVTFTFV